MADTGEVTEEKVPLPGEPYQQQLAKDNPGDWNPLVDLREVDGGNRGVTRQGTYGVYDAPIGVQLKLEQAIKSEPLVAQDKPWESGGKFHPVRAWKENGTFHMLYSSRGGVYYAQSEDAYHWTRPELGLIDFEGSTKNNMVTDKGGDMFKAVFEDRLAPDEERFKAMGCEAARVDPDTGEVLARDEWRRRMAAQEYGGPDYTGPRMELRGWGIGWASPDRVHWKRLETPIASFPIDGGISAVYDSDTGTYVAYCRIHGGRPGEMEGIGTGVPEAVIIRRSIGISRTKDFNDWPRPKLLIFPDGQDDLDVSFYGGDYFPYPGRSDLHCMLIQVFHQITDHMDSQIAFSRDGLFWYRPERRAIIPVGPLGSGDEGQVQSWGSGLVELPDGYWGSIYGGSSWLHNVKPETELSTELFPYLQPGQIRWARWQPHRFCGIEAEGEGQFTIPTIYRTKKELRLNYRTSVGGWVQVELLSTVPSRVHPDAGYVPGFAFDECDPLTGDSLDQVVTWQGKSDIAEVGQSVAIRIRMFQAKVFAYLV